VDPESVDSKDIFAHSAILLAATERVVIASGIANIYARDPMAMANDARALGETYPGPFVLGIGVSHAPSVKLRCGDYGKLVEMMRTCIKAMLASLREQPPADRLVGSVNPRRVVLVASLDGTCGDSAGTGGPLRV
jgi:alkanesulfonate monooxygenase SsuD/methylene tetrahydromethanopterin reductase-like flavin-dependent oxidoreductase (luciferase family)